MSDETSPKEGGKIVFRKRERVRVKATGETGTINMANNVKGNHLVVLHDTQQKRMYPSNQLEKLG